MSTLNPKRVADKLQSVINAWEQLRPTKSFAGMTLDQFKAKVQPSLTARENLSSVRSQADEHRAQRHLSDAASHELALLVVNAIKGDPEEGETSGLYAAMGYVPKDQRRSGLTRRGLTTTPLAQTVATN